MTRLSVVDHGHSLARKAILFVARFMMGAKVPDVVKTLFYRPKFFGDAQAAWTNQVLRGASEWSVGERELFAAFASRLNECEF
jgi:hypothetical protein